MKLHHHILSVFFAVFLLFSPVYVSAENLSEDDYYRLVLLELIETLQKQIVQLQIELESKEKFEVLESSTKDSETILSDSVDVVASYSIDNSSDASRIRDREHREYFERVFELFPSEYDRKVKRLMIFGGDEAQFDAFVETLPPMHKNWSYAVHEDTIGDEDSDPNSELIIHELSHIVSYEEIAGLPMPSSTRCDSYFDKHGCPPKNSYLGQFVKEFWSASDYDRVIQLDTSKDIFEETYAYYKKHEDEFVSDYAVQSPEEDFSESFTFFVMEESFDSNSLAQEKIDFFSRYQKILDIKAEIRSSL